MNLPSYNPIALPELREMLAEGDHESLKSVLEELHPATIAEFSEGLDPQETWRLLEHAPVERQAEIFTYYPMAKQVELVQAGGRDRISRLLEEMPPDDRVDLLQELDEETVNELLPLIAKDERQDIRRLLSYEEDTAGSEMTTDYAWLPEDITVSESIHRLREQAPDSETIYYIYVVDKEGRLVGVVSLRDLILARPDAIIRDIMHRDPVAVKATDDREHVAQELAKYNLLAIPVVDDKYRLVGIVTYDDAMDVVIEEATEDALRMGAVGTLDESILDAPFATVWRKRAVWLSFLFIAELMTFAAMAHFKDAVDKVLALSFFVPLCISTGGLSGAQAATLITRAVALGHLQPRDWWRVTTHELAMGLVLGLSLGAIGFLQVAVTPSDWLGLEGHQRWLLAITVSTSVMFICMWGTLVGSLMPLIFQRFGIDPGYASSPFVATFVDVTGIVIFFTVARWILL